MRSGCPNILGSCMAMATAVSLQGCQRGPAVHSLNSDSTRAIEGVQREVASGSSAHPAELITALHMPPNSQRYTLERPIILADLPGNPCTFLVGDVADQALHTYALDGTYFGSIAGTGTDSVAFPELMSAAAAPNGTIAVSDLYNRSVVVIQPNGTRKALHLAPVYPDATFGSQIALGTDNTIYENWFAHNVPTMSKAWSPSTPLVRVFTLDGQFVGTIGHVVPRDGRLFTAALSRGILRIQSDTAWFARRSDGRILAYPLGRRIGEPARQIDVPMFYRMRPPAEFVSADGKTQNVRVEDHIVAFDVTHAGEFVVAVATRYPHNDDEIFRPTTLIAVVSRQGEVEDLLDPQGQVLDVLGKGGAVVAIVVRGDGRSVDVFRRHTNAGTSSHFTACSQHI